MASSKPQEPRTISPKRIGFLLFLLVVSLSAIFFFSFGRPYCPPIVQPGAQQKLDPQVLSYIGTLTSSAQSSPSDPKRRAILGMAYAANGLWAEARQTFLDTAVLAPKEPLAPLYAAISLQELSDELGAWREFVQVSSNFPDFGPAWYRVGESALRRGDFAAAETAFRRLVQLAPHEWRGPAGLGEIHLRQGKYAEALTFLETAIKIDYSARPAHYLLGQVYRSVGRTNDARFELALGSSESRLPMPDAWAETAPNHMRLLPDQLVQADELSQLGQFDKAVHLLEEALRFHPGQAALLNQYAVVLDRAGRTEQALSFANQAINSDPQAASAHVTRALIQAHRGQFQSGFEDAQRALQLAPGLTQAYLAIAELWLRQDQDRKAIAALEEALRSAPQNAEIHVELADVFWHNLDEKGTALNHFQDAINLNPALARAWSRMGLLELSMGNQLGARNALRQLSRIAPDSAERQELESALNTQ